jgi:PEP-CTERM motif
MFKTAFGTVAAALALCAAAPAAAADYIVTYTGTSAINGAFSARLRLTVFGGFATAIRGTRNGIAVTALSPYAAATQRFSPTAPETDFGGISYGTTGGTLYNIFHDGALGEINSIDTPGGNLANESRFATFSVAGIPEPTMWAMMILGFGLVGGAMRRRSATVRTSVRFA